MDSKITALKSANNMLERKIKAEQAEKTLGNSSMISGANRYFSRPQDVLSRSIMENSMRQDGGNTSIMDIMSGYNIPSQHDMTNKSMRMERTPGFMRKKE